jgi:hypothetical protein
MGETAKRVICRVRWISGDKEFRWHMTLDLTFFAHFVTKRRAVEFAADYCRSMRESEGSPAQLVVHNKNGRIAFERTYGDDPRRSKG